MLQMDKPMSYRSVTGPTVAEFKLDSYHTPPCSWNTQTPLASLQSWTNHFICEASGLSACTSERPPLASDNIITWNTSHGGPSLIPDLRILCQCVLPNRPGPAAYTWMSGLTHLRTTMFLFSTSGEHTSHPLPRSHCCLWGPIFPPGTILQECRIEPMEQQDSCRAWNTWEGRSGQDAHSPCSEETWKTFPWLCGGGHGTGRWYFTQASAPLH